MKCANPEFLKLSQDILSRGACLRFQAKGMSMFPAVRDGDILNIWPVAPDEIKAQDIIFYRNLGGNLAAHRLIRKILSQEKNTLLVKGDFQQGDGEIISLENVLGKVREIERKGRKVNIYQGWGKTQDRFCYFGAPLIKINREIAGRLLRRIQGLPAYSHVVKRISNTKFSYQREPLGDNTERILAKAGDTLIGATTINRFLDTGSHYSGWWIFGTWVNWRYRCLGIGRQLTKICCDIAADNGATEVSLLVFQDNRPALNLYKNLGFSQVSIPEIDKELREETARSRRQRIILQKDISARV